MSILRPLRQALAPDTQTRARPARCMRRDGRVVEGARLESVYAGNRLKGSNPFLSATLAYLSS